MGAGVGREAVWVPGSLLPATSQPPIVPASLYRFCPHLSLLLSPTTLGPLPPAVYLCSSTSQLHPCSSLGHEAQPQPSPVAMAQSQHHCFRAGCSTPDCNGDRTYLCLNKGKLPGGRGTDECKWGWEPEAAGVAWDKQQLQQLLVPLLPQTQFQDEGISPSPC